MNDPKGIKSLSQNDLDNEKIKCTKFEVSIFISFEVVLKNSRTLEE